MSAIVYVTDIEENKAVLTQADRCDRCGGQAFGFADVLSMQKGKLVRLYFCGHHFAKHLPKLVTTAVRVRDERAYIPK